MKNENTKLNNFTKFTTFQFCLQNTKTLQLYTTLQHFPQLHKLETTLHSFTNLYKTKNNYTQLNYTQLFLIIQNITQKSRNSTKLYTIIQNFTKLDKTLKMNKHLTIFPRLYTTLQNSTTLYTTLQQTTIQHSTNLSPRCKTSQNFKQLERPPKLYKIVTHLY